ncbi:MAG: hypothetical protein WBX15_07965 [Thermoanaerobaculia bacterium]
MQRSNGGRPLLLLSILLVLLVACGRQEVKVEGTDTASNGTTGTEAVAVQTARPVTLSEGFNTPESVLYDPEQDVYFVSNINGQPLDKDGNGYISKIPATSQIPEAKWISSNGGTVKLDAPKGLAIVGDELWVTDIDVIRKFDRKTGEPKGDIAVPGSTFLNDLATAPDGTVYATDSGMKAGKNGFEGTGTDAVYEISKDGKLKKLATGDQLHRPNGVTVAEDGKIWVVTFGSNELFAINDGKKSDVHQLPKGSLDGVVSLGKDLLVSSWDGKAVYEGPPEGPFQTVVDNVASPADIGFDTRRSLILIPDFTESKVMIVPLPSAGVETSAEGQTATETTSNE